MAIKPIPRPEDPGFRGGQATPVKTGKRRLPARRAWGPKPGENPYGKFGQGPLGKFNHPGSVVGAGGSGAGTGSTNVVKVAPPEDPIMAIYRSTLAEIRKAAGPIDDNAIYKPYGEGMVVAGQIGQGAAAADAANSQRAQDQYGKASAEANAHAAAAGISAGGVGDANVTPDTTPGLLAQQSQAQQDAAIGAATAWQQLLNRVGRATVSKAHTDQETSIGQASMSLAASIPSMRNAKDTLDFQKKSQHDTDVYLRSTLTEKQRAAMAAEELADKKLRGEQLTAAEELTIKKYNAITGRTNATTGQGQLKERIRNDNLTYKGAMTRARMAAKNGVEGLDQVLAAIKPDKATQETPVTGYRVTYLADPNGINAGGPAINTTVTDPNQSPPDGYLATKSGKSNPVYGPTGKVQGGGVTLAGWNKGVGILMVRNGWTKAKAIKEMKKITPQPPPKKKGK